MKHHFHSSLRTTVFGLLALVLAAGCGRPTPPAGGPPPNPPVRSIVAQVVAQALEERITLVATLAANESVNLISEVDARIEEIGFEEGQTVETGQLLFRLDEARLQAAFDERFAQFELARINLERNRTLFEQNTISRQEFDLTRANLAIAQAVLDRVQAELDDATIVAPFSGQMTERLVSPGQFVTRGQPLASLVDGNPLKASFDVPERFLSSLAVGQTVRLRTTAFPGESFEGTVFFVSPRVDEDSRTILVRAKVDNSDQRLRPGMFGALDLVVSLREDALVIPEQAVFFRNQQPMVVVRNDEGLARFRVVETGLRLAGRVEIVSGLEEGELVVVEGHSKIFSEESPILVSPRSNQFGIDPADFPLPQALEMGDGEPQS